jgi:hypothetical protein
VFLIAHKWCFVLQMIINLVDSNVSIIYFGVLVCLFVAYYIIWFHQIMCNSLWIQFFSSWGSIVQHPWSHKWIWTTTNGSWCSAKMTLMMLNAYVVVDIYKCSNNRQTQIMHCSEDLG